MSFESQEVDAANVDNNAQQSRVGATIAEFLLASDAQCDFDVEAWLRCHADVAESLKIFMATKEEHTKVHSLPLMKTGKVVISLRGRNLDPVNPIAESEIPDVDEGVRNVHFEALSNFPAKSTLA